MSAITLLICDVIWGERVEEEREIEKEVGRNGAHWTLACADSDKVYLLCVLLRVRKSDSASFCTGFTAFTLASR